MPWDPVLKFFLLKNVFVGLVNNTRDPLKKTLPLGNAQNALPKRTLS